jgi:hypothetical protein
MLLLAVAGASREQIIEDYHKCDYPGGRGGGQVLKRALQGKETGRDGGCKIVARCHLLTTLDW